MQYIRIQGYEKSSGNCANKYEIRTMCPRNWLIRERLVGVFRGGRELYIHTYKPTIRIRTYIKTRDHHRSPPSCLLSEFIPFAISHTKLSLLSIWDDDSLSSLYTHTLGLSTNGTSDTDTQNPRQVRNSEESNYYFFYDNFPYKVPQQPPEIFINDNYYKEFFHSYLKSKKRKSVPIVCRGTFFRVSSFSKKVQKIRNCDYFWNFFLETIAGEIKGGRARFCINLSPKKEDTNNDIQEPRGALDYATEPPKTCLLASVDWKWPSGCTRERERA